MHIKKFSLFGLAPAIVIYLSFTFWQSPERQLKLRFNLCFVRDTPGATEAGVTLTPYYCDDESKSPIAEPFFGQWAEISKLNFGSDGSVEIVVESDRPFLNATCIPESKDIWKFIQSPDGKIVFKLISETEIPGPC